MTSKFSKLSLEDERLRVELEERFKELAKNIILYGYGTDMTTPLSEDTPKGSSVITRSAFLFSYRIYMTSSQLYCLWKQYFDEHFRREERPKVSALFSPILSLRKRASGSVRIKESATHNPRSDSIKASMKQKCYNIMEFIKEWIGSYLFEFNKPMRTDVLAALEHIKDQTQRQKLKLMIVRAARPEGGRLEELAKIGRSRVNSANKNILENTTILDFPTNTIAKTLTAYEFSLFASVSPREFLGCSWQKDDKKHKLSPNITRIINRFNEISYFVATEVIIAQDPRMQRDIVAKFIRVAKKCEQMNNFNTMMEIVAGLNNVAVQRLDYMWASVGEKYKKIFKELEVLMEPQYNYKNYREELKKRQHPILPYFGIFLRDYTFVTIGNEPFLSSNSTINHRLFQLSWSVMEDMQSYQVKSYPIQEESSAAFFLTQKGLRGFDDETLYKLSLDAQRFHNASVTNTPVQTPQLFRRTSDATLSRASLPVPECAPVEKKARFWRTSSFESTSSTSDLPGF